MKSYSFVNQARNDKKNLSILELIGLGKYRSGVHGSR